MEGLKSKWKRLLNKSKVVGFVGVIGSGKDFSADKYVFEKGFTRISFADPIRLLLSIIFGGEVVYEKYSKFKNTNLVLGFFWKTLTGRELLQKLGHGIRLIFGNDIYLEVMDRKIESLPPSSPGVVIPDVRYFNEAEYVLMLGGELYFCNYESERYDCFSNHESEQLAQALIALGFNHGDKLTFDDIKVADKIVKEAEKVKIENGK
jgi:hypothetical protein